LDTDPRSAHLHDNTFEISGAQDIANKEREQQAQIAATLLEWMAPAFGRLTDFEPHKIRQPSEFKEPMARRISKNIVYLVQ
jgi:hypothetical protein